MHESPIFRSEEREESDLQFWETESEVSDGSGWVFPKNIFN
jgi:hypothetical protein